MRKGSVGMASEHRFTMMGLCSKAHGNEARFMKAGLLPKQGQSTQADLSMICTQEGRA